MSDLMLHCGGEIATLEQIAAAPVPEATDSYCPISHIDFVHMLDESTRRHFGTDTEITSTYGLTRDGARMFGVVDIKMESGQHCLSIGVRNSLDKKFSAGVALGAKVFVCDNLCFSSSGINVFRKHTPNIVRDLRPMIDNAITLSTDEYRVISESWEAMKEIPVSLDMGYKGIGLAQGHGVLTPTQASVAFQEWQQPSHEEFEDRNAFCLYQAFTEAAKKGRPELIMDRYPAINAFFDEAITGRTEAIAA